MKTSAAKLIVDALLQRFLPLARRRIETAQAQDGQYLRPSDPAYEQVLDSLAMIARHTPGPLLEALLRWRESMPIATYLLGRIHISQHDKLGHNVLIDTTQTMSTKCHATVSTHS
ncbi:hypothetical protein MTR67_012371 [Solanum verrucosum]|uniref:Uncharacterized protein n=1 Tax=Solanum verrucosum TaxID=315347 RepID=A0AAF0QED7_SOLVR|nr:hypothetical protein MTR67_012371 [Solanum verrucosum]